MYRSAILAVAACLGLFLIADVIRRPSFSADLPRRASWEYKAQLLGPHGGEQNPEKLEKVLNEMASAGWELVNMAPYSDAQGPNLLMVVFRRPK